MILPLMRYHSQVVGHGNTKQVAPRSNHYSSAAGNCARFTNPSHSGQSHGTYCIPDTVTFDVPSAV